MRAALTVRFAIMALAAAAVAACGFHLQGRTPLPPVLERVYVETDNAQTDFVSSLTRSLTASGVRVTRDAADASAVVRILEDRTSRRVLSVSAANVPREYEITYSVRYAVLADERELLPAQELAGTRAYSFDERILLAKENEEDILIEALAGDLASAVMRRLAAL